MKSEKQVKEQLLKVIEEMSWHQREMLDAQTDEIRIPLITQKLRHYVHMKANLEWMLRDGKN